MGRWVLAALLLAGCTGVGQRAGGGCPADEQCSPDTPDGLHFLGSALGDDPLGRGEPLPIAVGGTQKIRLLAGPAVNAPALSLPFMAVSSGSALAIAGVSGPEVTVQGLAEGSAFLRIVEPGTGLLYDRIELRVRKVARSELKPRAYLNPAADATFAATAGKWLLFTAGSETCVVRLFDGQGERLTDEGMTMSVAGGGLAAGTRESWDTLGLTATGTTSGQVAVRTSDGVARDGLVTIATSVDAVAFTKAQGGAQSDIEPVMVGRATSFCFHAMRGTDLVAGVSFAFSASAGVMTTVAGSPNCVGLRADGPGTGLLTVKAAGLTREFPINFAVF